MEFPRERPDHSSSPPHTCPHSKLHGALLREYQISVSVCEPHLPYRKPMLREVAKHRLAVEKNQPDFAEMQIIILH